MYGYNKRKLIMLETIIFQMISPFLINPADPEGTAIYSAGTYENKNSYTTDKPATNSPMLTLNLMAYDGEFNTVRPGIYAVKFIPETKQLFITEGSKIIAKCPVIQLIELKDEMKAVVPSAVVGFMKDNKIFIVYKNENIEANGFLHKSSELLGIDNY